MKNLFRGSEDFTDVYLKGDGIYTTLAVNKIDGRSSDELKLSDGTQKDINTISNNDAVIVNNRLYIYGVAHISSSKMIYKHYSGINLFNIDWFCVEKVEKKDATECFYAFGWDNERSVPVFYSFVVMKYEGSSKEGVTIFNSDLLVNILPKLILSTDRDAIFNIFKHLTISDLIIPFHDDIVMTKWFNDNNLVKTVERRLIEKLGESEFSITVNPYRSGLNGFMTNLGAMLGFGYITSAYKDKLGYRLLGNIYDYDFELYISGYIYSNFGGTNIGVYPSFNELNFKHIDGLLKSLVVEIRTLEKDMYDVFERDERPNTFLLSYYGCSIDYGLIKLNRELNGFEVYRTDAYGKIIYVDKGEIFMVTTKPFFVDEEEPTTFKEIEISKRFKSHHDKQIVCSKRKVKLEIEDSTVSVQINPTGDLESYIITGDSDLIDEQLSYFIPLINMNPFNLEEAIKKCLS